MFLDKMEPGKCYSLRTTWGNELVWVTAVEADCVHARCLEDGRNASYRGATILAYKEAAGIQAAFAAEKGAAQPPVEEKAEPAAVQEAPAQPEKPVQDAPEKPTPVRRPSTLFRHGVGERLTGKLTVYFSSNLPNAGNGYIELPLPENAEPGERAERVFFHVRQIYEKKLYAFLNTLPRIPDYSGRPRGFQLSTPIEVTFVVADNRAHSKVGRPVAGDIRMTEAGWKALAEMAASEHHFLRSATAFVDGFRFAQGHDMCCSLTIQNDEDRPFSALLYEENIGDPRLCRFLMENRPRVPDGVALKVELFRKMAGGRPVGPVLAAHARLSGEETPWSERDEMRWQDLFDEETKEKLALVQSGEFSEQAFALRSGDAPEPAASDDDSREPSEVYEELPLWTEME